MSRGRRALAAATVALLAASAGCTGFGIFGGGSVDEAAIRENASYDWETEANASINVTSDRYQSVYRISGRETLEVYTRDGLGTERPLDVRAVKFRYPNGTVVGVAPDRVEKTRSRTVVDLPASEGQLAFTADHRGKTFSTPAFVDGGYTVTLPAGMRVDYVPLAQVQPRGYVTERVGDRVRIVWGNDVIDRGGDIVVRYYLARDLLIFAGVVALLFLVGLGGVGYYLLQIRRLEDRRQEVGLDVDTGDDGGGDGPPPGFG